MIQYNKKLREFLREWRGIRNHALKKKKNTLQDQQAEKSTQVNYNAIAKYLQSWNFMI